MTALPATINPTRSLDSVIELFIVNLERTNRSRHTIKNYRCDLAAFAASLPEGVASDVAAVSTEHIQSWLDGQRHLKPATGARRQASVSSFFDWAYDQLYIDADPARRVGRVKLPPPAPRGVQVGHVEKVLAQIPAANTRGRLLFTLIYKTGLRASEALGVHVEDLDMRQDDEHLTVLGKGGKRRTILLDDKALVKLLKKYLKETGYKYGPLFRATKNGDGGPICYQLAQRTWHAYCEKAGLPAGQVITLHQLRHTHATELINSGVSLRTIQRRLGHANMQTTLRYAEQSDTTADNEMREYQRRKRN